MTTCKHPPLSGSALMAQCATCGEFYDVAAPRWMRAPRTRRARRQPGETVDTAQSVFQRSSVMTPLAKPRTPRQAAQPQHLEPQPQHLEPQPAAAAPRQAARKPRPLSLEQECRSEYDRYILALFDRAQLECNEFISNESRQAGCRYTAWELFTHRKTVIAKWASEELITFFCFNRRLSYAQFRAQYREAVQPGQREEQDVA